MKALELEEQRKKKAQEEAAERQKQEAARKEAQMEKLRVAEAAKMQKEKADREAAAKKAFEDEAKSREGKQSDLPVLDWTAKKFTFEDIEIAEGDSTEVVEEKTQKKALQ